MSMVGRFRITPTYAGSTVSRASPALSRADHPHLRGEHIPIVDGYVVMHGSPPPTRGAPPQVRNWLRAGRITPTYAGSTRSARVGLIENRDHPHLRGEHRLARETDRLARGSPPPTRGARKPLGGDHVAERITPTYAGSTNVSVMSQSYQRDHPHLRGEHSHARAISYFREGSPPPTRGALARARDIIFSRGITPTYAGSTLRFPIGCDPMKDHPHLRGEHAS